MEKAGAHRTELELGKNDAWSALESVCEGLGCCDAQDVQDKGDQAL